MNKYTSVRDFLKKQYEHPATSYSTGFKEFDKWCGGIYQGLYVISARPALGKTTFCLQLADQIAEQAIDVIFFSLEQSRFELVTKSLARMRAVKSPKEETINSMQLRKSEKLLTAEDFADVLDYYEKKIDPHLRIIEGNFNFNVTNIKEYVEEFVEARKTRPVVFVDYLQILKPADSRDGTTKQNVDDAVTQLKRMSRDLGITVIVISSINRQSYLNPLDLDSLKESGGIEYTVDVAWGLQLNCVDEPADKSYTRKEQVKRELSEIPRLVRLVCLKNRYGPAFYSFPFEYRPDCDCFESGVKETYSYSRRKR